MNASASAPAAASASVDLDAAYAHCTRELKALDPDRYAACLFAPAESRPFLIALYAFNAELARIRDLVSEPMPGEIRHQWWREALSCSGKEAAWQNPVAAALIDTLKRFHLPPEPLLALIEARSFDLYADPMPTWLDLEGYCGETSSALIRLASLVLAKGEDAGSADLCGHAGVAYAITGLLRAFPIHARRQQCYIPHEVLIACDVGLDDIFEGRDSENLRAALAAMRTRAQDHLEALNARATEVAPAIRPAFYPVCLCRGYLRQMEAPDYAPFTSLITVSPLARLWTLTRSAWRAKRL
jgi:phytoene synthase